MGSSQLRPLEIVDEEAEPVDLIAASAGGDVRAFERLYARFAPCIYGLCLRLTSQREAAEDCTQESFVAAWRAMSRFEYRSRFSTWLQRIAIHTVLARRRGLRAWNEVAEPATGLPEVADPGAEAPLDLESAIAALPERARHVLVLVGIYGFSHAEAAVTLGVAEGTCKAQLHRARSLLVDALGLEE
ncbi:MAG TPA: RNA polymerase sigma factor [Steroidobacteraceae bacterium]|nr:RNA polymerase sigma factor [Steroidobacteraceae bacterium]